MFTKTSEVKGLRITSPHSTHWTAEALAPASARLSLVRYAEAPPKALGPAHPLHEQENNTATTIPTLLKPWSDETLISTIIVSIADNRRYRQQFPGDRCGNCQHQHDGLFVVAIAVTIGNRTLFNIMKYLLYSKKVSKSFSIIYKIMWGWYIQTNYL